jgi:hypothetical protein
MGMITVETKGSFKPVRQTFSAMEFGHAKAVADAIRFLAEEVLPEAIANDHRCHNDGISPEEGYGVGGLKCKPATKEASNGGPASGEGKR